MQAKEKELRAGGRENFPIKIIETAGKPLERILVKTDPFNGNGCSDLKGIPNRNPKNTISCRRNNVGYELKCKLCPATSYFGETGQNMHTRMKKHESKWRSKSLEIRKGSAFYVHMKNDHDDVDISGKDIDEYFEVTILKAYQKVLTRLVDEGTNLTKHKGSILNSKTEWHQPKIVRNVIIQGGAEAVRGNMGPRPNHPPLTPAPAVNVATPPGAQESSRTIRLRERQLRIGQ